MDLQEIIGEIPALDSAIGPLLYHTKKTNSASEGTSVRQGKRE